VSRKLFPVVERQTQPCTRGQLPERLTDRHSNFQRLLAVRATNQGIARATFHQRGQVPRFVRPVDQVTFPVSDALPRLNFGRTGVDHALVRNLPPPPACLPRAAPAPFAPGARKVGPQVTAGLGIAIDLLVDRLLTHRWTSLQPGAFTDDLWSQTLFEPRLDFCPDLIREPPRPRPQSPLLRLLVRLLWTVTPAACVAGKLPADAARRSPQAPSKLSQPISFLTPTVDVPAVCLCHTLVSHIVLQVFDHTKNITYRGAFSYNRCCNSRWNAGLIVCEDIINKMSPLKI